MEKVYFNEEKNGIWEVESLEDYYDFKAVDFQTNEISRHILSWSRNFDLSDDDKNTDRVYDVEIGENKYYFLLIPNEKDRCWNVISKDSFELEKLLRDNNLFFVGETKIVE